MTDNKRAWHDIISMVVMLALAVTCCASFITHSSYVRQTEAEIARLETELAQAAAPTPYRASSSAKAYESAQPAASNDTSAASPVDRPIYATPSGEKYHYANPADAAPITNAPGTK